VNVGKSEGTTQALRGESQGMQRARIVGRHPNQLLHPFERHVAVLRLSFPEHRRSLSAAALQARSHTHGLHISVVNSFRTATDRSGDSAASSLG
jgi:hypothetical protein